jgi:hypothetical protein
MGMTIREKALVLEFWRLLAGKPRWTPGMVDALEREA